MDGQMDGNIQIMSVRLRYSHFTVAGYIIVAFCPYYETHKWQKRVKTFKRHVFLNWISSSLSVYFKEILKE